MSDENVEMKAYFDKAAPHWDEHKEISQEDLRKLISLLPIQEGDRVLDVACGTGVATGLLAERSQAPVIGIDLSGEMISLARKKYRGREDISFLAADFLTYPFDKKFDFILTYNAYPHFLNREAYKKALVRNLKEGGSFAILHSLSRKALEKHHQHIQNLSRSLLPVGEEAFFYEDSFVIERAEEDESHYFILGKKEE